MGGDGFGDAGGEGFGVGEFGQGDGEALEVVMLVGFGAFGMRVMDFGAAGEVGLGGEVHAEEDFQGEAAVRSGQQGDAGAELGLEGGGKAGGLGLGEEVGLVDEDEVGAGELVLEELGDGDVVVEGFVGGALGVEGGLVPGERPSAAPRRRR